MQNYSVFNRKPNSLDAPMFFGEPVNVARYDQQKFEAFEKLTEKQISFFWRPDEIDVSRDRIDYANLPENEKHIFISNLKYQCLVEGTEVLTQNGWVKMTEYDGKDAILIYDLDKEETKWEIPSNSFTKQHSGKVYDFRDDNGFRQVVTPEHRMPFIQKNKRGFELAENMCYEDKPQKLYVPMNGDFIGEKSSKLNESDIFKLLFNAGLQVQHDHKSGKDIVSIDGLSRFDEIINKLDGNYCFTPIPDIHRDLNKSFSIADKDKMWCIDFIDTLIYINSNKNEQTNTCQVRIEDIDFIQSVATLAGLQTIVEPFSSSLKHKLVTFKQESIKDAENIRKSSYHYDGPVSCVTVSTGAFVVRYKNCVSVTGNCLLDSVQGRSPNAVLLPIASLPELETWITTWDFFEGIHSRSYTHIIRNIVNDPSIIFDEIIHNEEILKRADTISRYYDDLMDATQKWQQMGEGVHIVDGKEVVVSLRELKKKLYLCLMCVNILEAIRFYVSFA